MNWYLLALKKYATFSGRSRRKEYWMFVLFNFIISIILSILDSVLGLNILAGNFKFLNSGLLSLSYSLFTIIPSIAVTARRLHDTNKTGWFMLLPILPYFLVIASLIVGVASLPGIILVIVGTIGSFILSITLIVWLAIDGNLGSNQYGSDPKEREGSQFSDELLDN